MPDIRSLLDALGLSVGAAIGVALLFTLYILGTWMPVWYPALVAFRRRATLQRPFAFAFCAFGVIAGAFFVGWVAIVVPIQAVLVYVVPTLKAAGYIERPLLIGVFDFVYTWWFLASPVVGAGVSILVVRLLVNRWGRILEALG